MLNQQKHVRFVCSERTLRLSTEPTELLSVAYRAYKNTSFAAMTYMLAAAAHGLDTAPMEGFDANAVHKALGLPERYSVPLIVATGYAQVALTSALSCALHSCALLVVDLHSSNEPK